VGPVADQRVIFEVETRVPTEHGVFDLRAYRDRATGADHIAIVSGTPRDGMLVRLHSECLTGEAMGSLKCECGPQLDTAMDRIAEEGGVVIYLRGHEGRGIGLINKLRAYRLQEVGLDTLDANLALGLPADARDYGAAAAILTDMGISSVRLLSNNPEKRRQLEEHSITVAELAPLVVGVGAVNTAYLEAKRDRMGHHLPGELNTGVITLPTEGETPMSGHGVPRIDLANAQGLKVAVVAGMWHEEISEALVAGALRVLERAGVDIQVIRVPGSFELPVVAQAALRSGADAAVALGVIIRGGTPTLTLCPPQRRKVSPMSLCLPENLWDLAFSLWMMKPKG